MNQAHIMGLWEVIAQAMQPLSIANEWPMEEEAASTSGAQRFNFTVLWSPLLRHCILCLLESWPRVLPL